MRFNNTVILILAFVMFFYKTGSLDVAFYSRGKGQTMAHKDMVITNKW